MEWRAGGSRRLRNSLVRLLGRELCPFQVRGGGVGRLSSSSIATAMAPKLTTYVASRSSDYQVGARAIGVYVGGGEPVGTYRVVEGMGITNFTMVVPTVQSSRAPVEGMVSASTLPQRSAMAPPARRLRALMSDAAKPRPERALAEERRTAVRSLEERGARRAPRGYVHSGVEAVPPAWRMLMHRWARAWTGHAMEWPLRAWPMTSPRSRFFWLSKVRDACVARRKSASAAVVVFRVWCLMVNVTCPRQRG